MGVHIGIAVGSIVGDLAVISVGNVVGALVGIAAGVFTCLLVGLVGIAVGLYNVRFYVW